MPLPPVGDLLAALHVVAIPMRVPFRGVTTREVALLEGPPGGASSGRSSSTSRRRRRAGWRRRWSRRGWAGPRRVRDSVPVNATVPAVGAERVAEVLARFPGCTTAKVKVAERGQSLADDLARVAAVREVMGPSARVRVDANGGWSVDDALTALGTARSARASSTPSSRAPRSRSCATCGSPWRATASTCLVAADESIRKAEDPLRVRDLEAADVVVVKVAPLGGVRAALAVVEACGLPAVVSSALDTSVGIAAGVALAAALPTLDHACGLGTVALLDGDVASRSLLPVAGALPVGPVAADRGLLERHAAPSDRVAWWRERVAAAHAELRRGDDR